MDGSQHNVEEIECPLVDISTTLDTFRRLLAFTKFQHVLSVRLRLSA